MTLDELKNYVTSNKRICPVPTVWNKFLDVLEIKEQMPPNLVPLILNGWTASDLEKRKRLLTQIEYASKNVMILKKLEQLIISLKDDEWYYGDEPPSDKETPLI